LVLAKPAFVAAQLAPIFPDIAIAETAVAVAQIAASGIGPALLHRARTVSHFIGTHGPQPVDAVGRFRPTGPLAHALAQTIAETIGEWRITRRTEYAPVLQELPGPGSQRSAWDRDPILGPNCSAACKAYCNCQKVDFPHNLFPFREIVDGNRGSARHR
jgi:hypothetical protein